MLAAGAIAGAKGQRAPGGAGGERGRRASARGGTRARRRGAAPGPGGRDARSFWSCPSFCLVAGPAVKARPRRPCPELGSPRRRRGCCSAGPGVGAANRPLPYRRRVRGAGRGDRGGGDHAAREGVHQSDAPDRSGPRRGLHSDHGEVFRGSEGSEACRSSPSRGRVQSAGCGRLGAVWRGLCVRSFNPCGVSSAQRNAR